MLTFENDTKNELLEIHSDLDGLKRFKEIIENLITHTEKSGTEHVHLMTKNWGGDNSELTDEKQCEDNKLINHVKIFCWHNKHL